MGSKEGFTEKVTSQMHLERINIDGLEKGWRFIPGNEWPSTKGFIEQEVQ